MRIAIELPDGYPRRFVWFMECDVCRIERSEPAWDQSDIPLSMFAERGWLCEQKRDACPDCRRVIEVGT